MLTIESDPEDGMPTSRQNMVGHLEEELNRLMRLESPTLPILSVYLDLSPERIERRSINPRLRDLLDPIEKLATSGELDHDASMSLRAGINRVLEMAPRFETLLGSSLAVFVCDGVKLEEHLTMPRGAWDCAAAGPTPYLRPLRAVLDQFRKVAAVVLDSRTAEIDLYYMGEALHREVIEVEELRKSKLAGWYALEEYRHRLHAEEVRHHLFREVAEQLNRFRRDFGVELVLVGGQSKVTGALLSFLDPKLRAMTETFVIDLHTLTPPILATRVAELEEMFELREESSMVDEVYALFDAGDMGAVGVEDVLQAANHHAISDLLVHDSAAMEGSLCLECGALQARAKVCLECGGPTEALPDLFEALARAVAEAGGSVEHVMAPTRLAEDLVAARLRFVSW